MSDTDLSSDQEAPQAAPLEPHLLDRLTVLYRHRLVAGAACLLTAAIFLLRAQSVVPMYMATAKVLIQDEQNTPVPGLDAGDFAPNPAAYYETEQKLLTRRSLIKNVVERLRPQAEAEFNSATPPTLTQTISERVGGAVALVHPGQPPDASGTPPAEDDGLVDAFAARLMVDPVEFARAENMGFTQLVNVRFRARDPGFAKLAVNTVVDEYAAEHFTSRRQATQDLIDWVGKELLTQQHRLEDSERALAEFRAKQDALSLDQKQNIVVARLNQLNDEAMKAKGVRAQREAQYAQVAALPPGASPDTLPVVAQNVTLQALRTKLGELQRERQTLSDRYGSKHPQIANVNASIADTERQVAEETERTVTSIKSDYRSAVLEEETLKRAVDAATADTAALDQKSVNYGIMERETKSEQQAYETLLARQNELGLAISSRANNVRVAERADTPPTPVSTTGPRTWLLALVLGMAVGGLTAFGVDYMSDSIGVPEDVVRRLQMPCLGFVPEIKGHHERLLTSKTVQPEFAEAFRALRTAHIMKYRESGPRIIMVTSAQPLEGKTTTACNIAMAFAFTGTPVLLIDADMRRPGVHRALKIANTHGLSDLLNGRARASNVTRQIMPNLTVLTAGSPPKNPSELLSSERTRQLLRSFDRSPFKWVIIDTPPVLGATDAVVLAPHVSGVTMVVAERTRVRHAQHAIEQLLQSPTEHVAVVLNRVDTARNKYYYSRAYGKSYSNYYGDARVKEAS